MNALGMPFLFSGGVGFVNQCIDAASEKDRISYKLLKDFTFIHFRIYSALLACIELFLI